MPNWKNALSKPLASSWNLSNPEDCRSWLKTLKIKGQHISKLRIAGDRVVSIDEMTDAEAIDIARQFSDELISKGRKLGIAPKIKVDVPKVEGPSA